MIDVESQNVASAIPLAHWSLFFIASDCSPCIYHEPGNIAFQSNEEYQTMKSQQSIQTTKQQAPLSEFRSNQFCRELRLPAEVEPDKTTAVLKDGVLELAFAKAAESKPVDVEVTPE